MAKNKGRTGFAAANPERAERRPSQHSALPLTSVRPRWIAARLLPVAATLGLCRRSAGRILHAAADTVPGSPPPGRDGGSRDVKHSGVEAGQSPSDCDGARHCLRSLALRSQSPRPLPSAALPSTNGATAGGGGGGGGEGPRGGSATLPPSSATGSSHGRERQGPTSRGHGGSRGSLVTALLSTVVDARLRGRHRGLPV